MENKNNIQDNEKEIMYDNIMYMLEKITFWARIIGFYFLFKIITTILKLAAIVIAGSSLLTAFNELF